MNDRLAGFYVVEYEGVNADGSPGRGVASVKDGKIRGGDAHSCFVGTFEEKAGYVIANVSIFPLSKEGYRSITGYEIAPWTLPDIRGKAPSGELPVNVVLELDGQRYDSSRAGIVIRMTRLLL